MTEETIVDSIYTFGDSGRFDAFQHEILVQLIPHEQQNGDFHTSAS